MSNYPYIRPPQVRGYSGTQPAEAVGSSPNPQTTVQTADMTFHPEFEDRLKAMTNQVRRQGGDMYVFSGPRGQSEQGEMLRRAAARFGDMKEAMKRIKAPGDSTHDPLYGLKVGLGRGALGADIRGDLHIAHEIAPRYGLVFPSQSQPWHMEYAGLDKIK